MPERDTWGQAIVVPASLLMVSQKVGGVTAGAFDEDGQLVGMVYGLTGPRDGRLGHWSHMLAVSQGLRSLGIGRELKLFQSEIQNELLDERSEVTVEGVSNLPAPLARFLAERTQDDRFSYEVRQDPVRGWIIAWKEYTAEGIVRGSGQFYERPYAWLEE